MQIMKVVTCTCKSVGGVCIRYVPLLEPVKRAYDRSDVTGFRS